MHAEAQRVLSGNTNDDDVVIVKNLVKVGQLGGEVYKSHKRYIRLANGIL